MSLVVAFKFAIMLGETHVSSKADTDGRGPQLSIRNAAILGKHAESATIRFNHAFLSLQLHPQPAIPSPIHITRGGSH